MTQTGADSTEKFSTANLVRKTKAASLIDVNGQLEIPGLAFVEMLLEMAKVFEIIGSALSFAKSDILTKTERIKEILLDNVQEFTTLQGLSRWEIANNRILKPDPSGTRCCTRMRWLVEFMIVLCDELSKPGVTNLSQAVSKAYEVGLAQHHSWVIRKTVSVALYVIPADKQTFLKALGSTEEESLTDLKEFRKLALPIYDNLLDFHVKNGLDNIP